MRSESQGSLSATICGEVGDLGVLIADGSVELSLVEAAPIEIDLEEKIAQRLRRSKARLITIANKIGPPSCKAPILSASR